MVAKSTSCWRGARTSKNGPTTCRSCHRRLPLAQAIWTCGAHRVLCGDATDRDSVSRSLVTTRPELMVTDPPYGIAYNPAWREQAGLGRQRQVGLVQNDDRADWAAA